MASKVNVSAKSEEDTAPTSNNNAGGSQSSSDGSSWSSNTGPMKRMPTATTVEMENLKNCSSNVSCRTEELMDVSFWWGFCTFLFCVALIWASMASYYAYDGDVYYGFNDPRYYPAHTTLHHRNGEPYTEEELDDLYANYYSYSGYGTDWILLSMSCFCVLFVLPLACIFATMPPVMIVEKRPPSTKNPSHVL